MTLVHKILLKIHEILFHDDTENLYFGVTILLGTAVDKDKIYELVFFGGGGGYLTFVFLGKKLI
jgi:hypothetical protein